MPQTSFQPSQRRDNRKRSLAFRKEMHENAHVGKFMYGLVTIVRNICTRRRLRKVHILLMQRNCTKANEIDG
jgi:hypothetical protein